MLIRVIVVGLPTALSGTTTCVHWLGSTLIWKGGSPLGLASGPDEYLKLADAAPASAAIYPKDHGRV
jgi:hypothetical protein